MPYEVRRDGPVDKPYCVYKVGSSDMLGCHPSQRDAERQMAAILVSSQEKSAPASAPGRLALIITSNAYQDRSREIIRQKALEDWVAYTWKSGVYNADNPLLFWHGGDPIGDVIFADTEGPFLIEVARERPDTIVNLMPPGSPPVQASIKGVWDALETDVIEWGASHEFLYLKEDGKDGVYDRIVKTESSVLPRSWADNAYTLFSVIKE